MNRIKLLLCLFSISTNFLINPAQARSARRLEGEGIQGGDNANEGQFPYHVSLEADGENICGGSILSEHFIITAAHCVIEENNSFADDPLKVVVGINDLESKSSNRVAVDVVEVYVPKEYDATSDERLKVHSIGDIAILKLKKNLNIKGNRHLSEITLPKKQDKYDGKKAIISGFGYNKINLVHNSKTGSLEEDDGERDGKLRFAEANILSHPQCQKYYPVVKVTKTHLCAGLVQRKKSQSEGVCSGDSGGPLVHKDVQIGVLSVSPYGCDETTHPAIYTKVSDYLEFISKVVHGKTDKNIRKHTLQVKA